MASTVQPIWAFWPPESERQTSRPMGTIWQVSGWPAISMASCNGPSFFRWQMRLLQYISDWRGYRLRASIPLKPCAWRMDGTALFTARGVALNAAPDVGGGE